MRWLLLNTLILFCTINSNGQVGHLTFRHITRSTGLPVDKVTSLAQDSSGFIWIGSEEGLFRYDGFNFKAFYSDSKKAITLPENIITKIFVSSKGLLWIGTVGGGITCMSNDGRVIKVWNSKTCRFFSPLADHISDIKEDSLGNIWCTSVDGLFKLSSIAKEPECYKIKTSVSRGNLFNGLAFGPDKKIWLAGFLGFYVFDDHSKLFIAAPINYHALTKKDVAALEFHGDNLWFSSWAPDLGNFNVSKTEFHLLYSDIGKLQPDYDKMCNQFYVDKKGNLWIATGKGLFYVKKDETSVSENFFYEPGNNFSIGDNGVTSILEDREGSFWFGTKQGISIAQPYDQKIVNLSTNVLMLAPYGNKNISGIIEANNNTILISTHHADGIYETDSNFTLRKHYSFGDVKYDWVWRYFDDEPHHRILISTQEGVLVYDKLKTKLSRATTPLFNNRNTISAFASTSDSILWFSRFRDFFVRYNLNTGKYKEYSLQQLGEPQQVLYLSKDKDNHIWLIGHASGLLRIDEETGKVVERLSANNTFQSLRQTNISFFEDIGNYFLIGYLTKGISLYNKQSKRFEHFTQSNGLASNNTKSVFVASDNQVWIATSNGLSLFTISDKSFRNYNYENGILSNDLITITRLHSGKLAVGTTNGIFAFDPAQIDRDRPLPAPIISEINVYGKKITAEAIQQKPLEISYRENYFSIEYLSLQYNNNSEIEYAYKLEGLDKGWINAGKRRFASYSNIKGGHYVFKVRARRPGTPWVESAVALPIIVHSAFYTRLWFYALCILVIVAISYALFRYRIQHILKMERMRTLISSDLHDEVGASLTSISIFSEMARKSAVPFSGQEQYLQRIGERSRESIEKMSDIIWSINPDNDNLQQMLVRMKNYATEISEASDIAIHWSEAGNLSSARLSMEQRKNIYLLFKEAMNNIVKHAGAKNISVHLTGTSSTVTMKITDDGKGYDQHNVKYGNGIKSIHRRAEALKGNIIIQSEESKGTSVFLEFRH